MGRTAAQKAEFVEKNCHHEVREVETYPSGFLKAFVPSSVQLIFSSVSGVQDVLAKAIVTYLEE